MGVGRGMVGRVAWVRVEKVEWSCEDEVVRVRFFWEGDVGWRARVNGGRIRTNLR
jgi:hypothetical protein